MVPKIFSIHQKNQTPCFNSLEKYNEPKHGVWFSVHKKGQREHKAERFAFGFMFFYRLAQSSGRGVPCAGLPIFFRIFVFPID
uniref:Uncharacterized protein n=1 Tax=Candidatus Kentrum sp. SD TaxID=2126332 RepID=A0A451BKQ6_9GAMM|nr:MAG: hypothetical protein BECKSD772D_GA0070982_10282 [Candidatus Kentron sp. SD]